MTDRPPSRSYDQWCGLALALDHLGDRWTLLVIRELLAGPRRYTDLRANLPGIATNLLAQRLRDLEADGLIARRDTPAPTPATLYELTAHGRELEPVVLTLTRWGSRLMPAAQPVATMRPSWVALALRALLEPRVTRTTPPVDAAFSSVDHTPIRLVVQRGSLTVSPSAESPAEVVRIEGDPHALLAVITGSVTLAEAKRAGDLSVRGPRAEVAALVALLTPPAQGAA